MAEPMDLDIATPNNSMGNYDQQNISPPRCPYRVSANPSAANSHFHPAQHPALQQHPSLPPHHNHFHSNHLPNTTWDYSVNHLPLQPPFSSTLDARFRPPFDSSNQLGRAPELSRFDNFHGLGEGRQQPHPSSQPQQPQFQEHRSRAILYPSTPMSSSISQSGGNPAESSSAPPRPSSLVVSSSYNTISTRQEPQNTSSLENAPSNLPSRENGHASLNGRPQLPVPFDQYRTAQDRLIQGLPLPSLYGAHRYPPNSNQIDNSSSPPSNPSHSRPSLPPPRMPPLDREYLDRDDHPARENRRRPPTTSLDRQAYYGGGSADSVPIVPRPSSSQQTTARNWQQVQESTYMDFDSDDSLDEGPPDYRNNPRRYGTGPSGFNNRLFPDEGALERARAARRAQQAAVKFVASATALASFEKVDLNTLKGDESNCIICYNDFGVMNPDGHIECPVRLPKCKHIFGDHCIKQWLKDSDSCPYCRDKLPSEPKHDPKPHRDDLRRVFGERVRNGPPLGWSEPNPSDDSMASEGLDNQPFPRDDPVRFQHVLRGHMNLHEQEMLAIIRREVGDDPELFSQAVMNLPHRQYDSEAGRSFRRTRGRHSLGRISSTNAIRPNGGGTNSARVIRNHQQTAMRTPVQNSFSFDGGSTAQQRSITPHPAGLSGWPNQQASQPTSSGRPSSLPNERSPIGQASENTQPNIPGYLLSDWNPSRPIRPVSPTIAPAIAPGHPHFGLEAINGRPANAAEFFNQMDRSRQATVEAILNHSRSDFSNQENGQIPPIQPQDNEFHQQFPHPAFHNPWYGA